MVKTQTLKSRPTGRVVSAKLLATITYWRVIAGDMPPTVLPLLASKCGVARLLARYGSCYASSLGDSFYANKTSGNVTVLHPRTGAPWVRAKLVW